MLNIIATNRILSVWIFLYFLLYSVKLVPFNPIILLCLAYGFALVASIKIIYNTNKYNGLLYYFFINTVFKLIPILLIYKHEIKINDIIFTVCFILSYVVYMFFIKDDIVCLYNDMINYYIDEKTGRQTEIARVIRQNLLPYIENYINNTNPKEK